MLEWSEYIKIFVAIISVVDPLGAIPIFLGHTTDNSRKNRRMLTIATLTALFILVLSALFGESILKFFGISMAAFRLSGGILVVLMGFELLHAHKSRVKHTPEEAAEIEHKDAIAVVPLGIPLLAGPGAISTVIMYSHQGKGAAHTSLLCFVAFCVIAASWIILRMASPVARFLGRTGMNVISRLMGLILIAIGVEFIAHGLEGLFPILCK